MGGYQIFPITGTSSTRRLGNRGARCRPALISGKISRRFTTRANSTVARPTPLAQPSSLIKSDSNRPRLSDLLETVAKRGVCPEWLWPYKIRKFRSKPSRKSYREAKKHPALVYHRLTRKLAHMKICLASGYPFIVGITVFDSFESKKLKRTGRASMPRPYERSQGGHAVLVVGYEEAHRHFIVRNSWGTNWGMNGYFTLPYDYLNHPHLSDDFWTITVVR